MNMKLALILNWGGAVLLGIALGIVTDWIWRK